MRRGGGGRGPAVRDGAEAAAGRGRTVREAAGVREVAACVRAASVAAIAPSLWMQLLLLFFHGDQERETEFTSDVVVEQNHHFLIRCPLCCFARSGRRYGAITAGS